MIEFTLNGRPVAVDTDPDEPLLWVLRDRLMLMGTKYGCGIGRCGACSVHVDGEIATACTLPVGNLQGRNITTIEGLAGPGDTLHPVQRAWLEEDVSQCGYCQPGQIMAAAHLLQGNPSPSDAEIEGAMTNLCRCGTYVRIRKAIHRAAALLGEEG
jgi:aerobic-type carbon monoxide dehydrogenase small subunit (CoxS/CutS family)